MSLTWQRWRDEMDDMISRQAAINALIRKRQPVNNGDGTITITMMTDEVIRDVLNELPSVQPQRWIPVVEALPEDDEEVIVTCLDDSGDTPFSYTTVAWHYKGMWVCDNERCPFVIAWMPLPEPYTSGTDMRETE